MSKYIIKNCPCYDTYSTQCYDTPTQPIIDIPLCQNRIDCLLKQIVELCKQRIVKYQNKDFFKYEDVRILNGEAIMSRLILGLLEIEEILE